MALQNTNLIIQMAPVPATFVGTPGDLATVMVRRMRIVSPTGTNFITISDVEPSSNVGPWLKNGTQWWVFDEATKRYVPQDISEAETKWFQTGSTVPTTVEPPVWLKTTEGTTAVGPAQGTPVGWYLFNGAAWLPFTELQDGEVTLFKLADGVPGSIIVFGADERPGLQTIGSPGQFLGVNDAGTAPIYRNLPATSLVGLLSPNILGPLTDSGGYDPNTQSVTITLSEDRETLVYCYGNVQIANAAEAIFALSVDGTERDSASIRDAAGTGTNSRSVATLMSRQTLIAGNHTLSASFPAPGVLVDPINNNGRLPVKFVIQLL